MENYYVILGIHPGSSPKEIRDAFRRKAMELHPDRSAGAGYDSFLKLQKAYDVLKDPANRAAYDREIRPKSAPAFAPSPEPMTRAEVPYARPVTPPGFPEPIKSASLAESFGQYSPSAEELFERWWRNFFPAESPKSEHLEDLTVEIPLTAAEAWEGGEVAVDLPTRQICPQCHGRRSVGPYECIACHGQGARLANQRLILPYPAGLTRDHVIQIPLHRFGIDNFYLTVILRITGGSPW